MKKINLPKIDVSPAKALGILVTGLTVAATLLSTKVESDNRQAMKDELKKEILNELTSPKN